MERYVLPKNRAFLIAIKGFVFNEHKELLMLKVASNLKDSDKWDLPGGLLEIDEDIEDALKREVKEETGLSIKVGKLMCFGETIFSSFIFEENDVRDVRLVVLGFECKVEKSGSIVLSEEHDKFKWLLKQELKNIQTSRPTKGLFINYLK